VTSEGGVFLLPVSATGVRSRGTRSGGNNVKPKIKSPENFWSGMLFIGFGVLTVVISRDYPVGSAVSMGPGYFPIALGSILTVLGAIITSLSLKVKGDAITPFAWRPMVLLSLAFACYGLAIDHIGFISALFVLILLSAAAGREFKWKEVLIMSATLIAGSWLLFIRILELPFPLFWWR
jgi:hypothetical protein